MGANMWRNLEPSRSGGWWSRFPPLAAQLRSIYLCWASYKARDSCYDSFLTQSQSHGQTDKLCVPHISGGVPSISLYGQQLEVLGWLGSAPDVFQGPLWDENWWLWWHFKNIEACDYAWPGQWPCALDWYICSETIIEARTGDRKDPSWSWRGQGGLRWESYAERRQK